MNVIDHKCNRNTAILICLLAAVCLLLGCAKSDSEPIISLDQLNSPDRKNGMADNTGDEKLVAQKLPQAKIEFYKEGMTGYLAVSQGKLDAFVYGKLSMETAIQNGLKGVRLLDETLGESYVMGVGLSPESKIPDLENKINAFLNEIKANGTLDEIADRWLVRKDMQMPEIELPKTFDTHLVVGTSGVYEPFTFYVGTELAGYDIELAYRFAAWLGATLEFKVYDYDGIVAAAQSGDVDCIFAALFITPERLEALRYSQPTYVEEIAVMVRDDGIAQNNASGTVRWQDYNGKKLGVLVGPLMEDAAKEFFPDSEYLLFDSYPDCVTALLSGKIDGFLGDEPGMKSLHAEQPEVDYIHESLTENNYSFAFRKDDPESAELCEELNVFLKKCWEDGTMEELDLWFGVDEAKKVVDMSDLTGENGTIRVVTTSTDMPWSYIKDGKHVGYDIDLVVRFCRDRGYALEIGDVDFAGRIPAIQSGKYDFTTDMNVTPERMEQVLFSDPTSHGGIVLAVRASDLAAPSSDAETRAYQSVDELQGKRIGVVTGTIHDSLVEKRLPTAQIVYFNAIADMLDALKAGKIDALVRPLSSAVFIRYEDESVTWLDEHLTDADVSFTFPKTEEGKAQNERFSDFIRELRSSGELDRLREKWFGEDESVKTMIDLSALPAANGTLTLATTGSQVPFNYVRDNTVVGFEIELVARFCEENGYGLKVEQMNFDGVLASVQAGKCDFACACLAVTEERKESVDFAEPHFAESVVFMVPNVKPAEAEAGFFASIGESFEKTFIRENRWQLFLQGIGTTMLITVLSIVFGTLLGFAVFMLCRNGNPFANAITRFFVWLVQGMPIVVLLMILYYIIFGKVNISGAAVSVVGFTLVFGSAVFGMLRSGVGAIDKGQLEAAYALGYTNRKAFFRIILPQALPHFMPAYKGEITALIKATAVVGYVAVQDLTKMGDIVRSRTYEAFFPLIAVAIIYFILAAILTFLVNRIEIRIEPRRRSKKQILKGVKTDD